MGSERKPFPDEPIENCPICGTSVTGEWAYDSREDVYTLACDSPLGERHQVTAGGQVFSIRMDHFIPPSQYRPLLEKITSARQRWTDKLLGRKFYYLDEET